MESTQCQKSFYVIESLNGKILGLKEMNYRISSPNTFDAQLKNVGRMKAFRPSTTRRVWMQPFEKFKDASMVPQ